MNAIQDLAYVAKGYFTTGTRTDGTTFVKTSGDAPEWVVDLCRAAHDSGNMLPDDTRYMFILEALDCLILADDLDDAYLEASEKTHVLTSWLASRADRYDYCDRAMEERGDESYPGMVSALQMGQALEKNEVLDSVRSSLEDMLGEDDEDGSDDQAE